MFSFSLLPGLRSEKVHQMTQNKLYFCILVFLTTESQINVLWFCLLQTLKHAWCFSCFQCIFPHYMRTWTSSPEQPRELFFIFKEFHKRPMQVKLLFAENLNHTGSQSGSMPTLLVWMWNKKIRFAVTLPDDLLFAGGPLKSQTCLLLPLCQPLPHRVGHLRVQPPHKHTAGHKHTSPSIRHVVYEWWSTLVCP